MRKIKKGGHLLFWLPRGLALIYIPFLAIFALDVFVPGRSFLEIVIALFIHLLPSLFLLALLLIAWKREVVGGLLFIVIGICFTLFFNTLFSAISFFIVSFPALLIGILFVVIEKIKR